MKTRTLPILFLITGGLLLTSCSGHPPVHAGNERMCNHGPGREAHSSEHQCTDITYDEFEQKRQSKEDDKSDSS